jgi:hypothetical protein
VDPEPRPAWVNQAPGWVGDTYRMTVRTDPRPSREECEQELPDAVSEAVRVYAKSQLGCSSRIVRRLDMPAMQRTLVKQTWPEPVDISFPGEWIQLHALLEFDEPHRNTISTQCDWIERELGSQDRSTAAITRLWYAGTGLATVLMLLGVLFGCLKIDQATGGSCRGRVWLGGAAAVLMVAGLATLALTLATNYPTGVEVSAPAVSGGGASTDELAATGVPAGGTVRATAGVGMLLLIPLLALGLGIVALLIAYKRTRVAGILLLLGGLGAVGGLLVLLA